MAFILINVAAFGLFYVLGGVELRGWAATRTALLRWPSFVWLAGIVALAILLQAQPFSLPILLVFSALLLALVRLDVECGLVSDWLVGLLAALGLFAAYAHDALVIQLALAAGLGGLGALLAGPYSKWRGRAMLGWGDVKFFAAAGLWLPLVALPWFLIISGAAGAAYGVVYRRVTGKDESPFLPALGLALLVCVVVL